MFDERRNPVLKTFIPGDKWLYLKLYTGFKTADKIIVEILPELILYFLNNAIITKWFFIRYSDPHFHLRIRFCINGNENLIRAMISIFEAFNEYIRSGLIWNVQYDTYKRELNRYGEATIDHAEDIFYIDSVAVMRILCILNQDNSEEKRWLIALKMIDTLLHDFNFSLNRKRAILGQMTKSFIDEFEFSKKEYKVQLDRKYRLHRSAIDNILFEPSEQSDWITPIILILHSKSKEIKPIATDLLEREKQNMSEIPLDSLLISYIHMMINRLFRSKQRLYEMVLYDMLYRAYSSYVARTTKISIISS